MATKKRDTGTAAPNAAVAKPKSVKRAPVHGLGVADKVIKRVIVTPPKPKR